MCFFCVCAKNWRIGDKPVPEPMLTRFPDALCGRHQGGMSWLAKVHITLISFVKLKKYWIHFSNCCVFHWHAHISQISIDHVDWLLTKRLISETGTILCMRPVNERWRYSVTLSLIGWAHTQNDHSPSAWYHTMQVLYSNKETMKSIPCLNKLIPTSTIKFNTVKSSNKLILL